VKEDSHGKEPASEDVAFILPVPAKGIDGIEGKDLPFAAWFLLNEAFSCLKNNEHYACIACLIASVEIWLRRETKKRRLKLEKLIDHATETGLISSEEKDDLDELRKLRNKYIHFDLRKLPKVKDGQVTVYKINDAISSLRKGEYPKGKKVAAYPTPEYEDLIPLLWLAGNTQIFMKKIKEFYEKRFPSKSG